MLFKSRVSKTVLHYKNFYFSLAIFDSAQTVGAQCNDIMFTEKICSLERYLLLLFSFNWWESFRNGQEIGLKHCAVCQNEIFSFDQQACCLKLISKISLLQVIAKKSLLQKVFHKRMHKGQSHWVRNRTLHLSRSESRHLKSKRKNTQNPEKNSEYPWWFCVSWC